MSATSDNSASPVFAPAIAAMLVLVAGIALFFYIVFAAYAPDASGRLDPRENALSHSAVGFAALEEFLKDQGIPVLVSRGLTSAEEKDASLIILTPSIANDGKDIGDVTASDRKLIVLPKWDVAADLEHPGWVSRAGLYDTASLVERLLKDMDPSTKIKRLNGKQALTLTNGLIGKPSKTGTVELLQMISGDHWTGYLSDDRSFSQGTGVVLAVLSGTETYVLSDPDLLNTRGLHDIDTARTAVSIIQSLRKNNGPVILDITLAGYRRSPNILRLMFEPPLLAATLCIVFAAILLGMHAAARFGPADEGGRVFAFGKQALADNSAALIARTKRQTAILPRYADAVRRRVARAIGVSVQGGTRLNALLDAQRPKGSDRQKLSDIFSEAEATRTEADALAVARKLYRWKEK